MIPLHGTGFMPLTPGFLLATASAFVGLREEGGNNRGVMIELFLKGVKQPPGQPWCAAFVHHVGYWSHYDHQAALSAWPLPATASCWELGDFARRKRILVEEDEDPAPGDIFLTFDPMLGRFAHTGIVVRPVRTVVRPRGNVWYECATIEGNTNEEGSREGNAVVAKERRFYPEMGDRFVRWVDLDKRGESQSPKGEGGDGNGLAA